jgi:hypothetical protein
MTWDPEAKGELTDDASFSDQKSKVIPSIVTEEIQANPIKLSTDSRIDVFDLSSLSFDFLEESGFLGVGK